MQEFNSSTGAYMSSFYVNSTDKPVVCGLAISGSTIWVSVPGQTKNSNHYCGPYLCTYSGSWSCTLASGSGCGTTGGKYNSNGVSNYDSDALFLDYSGNVWGSDESNSAIHEYSSNGGWVKNLPFSSNPNNETGVYVDSSGNVWVTSEGTNTLYEINPSTGAVMQSFTSANGKSWNTPQLPYFNAR